LQLLNCRYFNAQSVVNKTGDLHDILYNITPDCVFICESWLHEGICNGLLDPRNEYAIFRKDRLCTKGGGVCALIKHRHAVVPIDLPEKYSDLELLVLDFVEFTPVLRVFVVYRPPHYDVKAVSYVRLLTECLNGYQSNKKNLHLIVGDLNLPYVNWNVFTGPSDDINSIILNFVIDNGYNQLVDFETRGSNLLDVLLTDSDTLTTSLTTSPPIGNSDHITIEFSLSVFCDVKACNTRCTPRRKFYWDKADFQSMNDYLCGINWLSIVYENPSAICTWTAFANTLHQCIDLFVPSRIVQNSNTIVSKQRRTLPVRKCARKKLNLWKKLNTTPYDLSLRSKYRDCAYEWRRLIRQSELLDEERIVNSNNLGAFYRFVYKRTTNRCGIGAIIDKNGSPITDSQQKANAFNLFFASVGVIDNNVVPHCENITLCSVLDSIIINETDVTRSINKLRSNSSCGPDSLPPVLFKRLKFCLSYPLTLIYNQLISVGAVPEEWLSAHVTPVFKRGQSGDISNYRPISLTCVPSKILERIIANKILDHLYLNNILCKAQHGFVRRRSTCTNLLESLDDWTLCIQTRQQVSVVYIDFSKAFDVVSHNKLIARLYSYGVRGSVLLWIKNFLSNRTQQTRVEVSLSDVVSLLSGVVQGSGIGPVLFLTYINELANILESYGVHVKLFADDVKLYLQITNEADVVQLQCAIDALTCWADEWQLSVSVNKCCTLNIGRAICDTHLTINGSVLPTVESVRDLGVSVTQSLSPSLHVSNIVAKANQRAAAIYRAFTSRDIVLLLRAYTTYVRPIVEHDSVVWSPYTVKDIDAVESVQRRFTKRLPGYKSLTYSERLKRANLLSLELRRLHFDLVWCYKILFGRVDMMTENLFEWAPHSSTRGHKYKLYRKSSSASVRYHFFSERVVNVWNSLPEEVDFSTVKSFTRTIKRVSFNDFVSY